MILKFPDLDILRHALLSGIVPTSVSTQPATAGFDDENRLWIAPSVSLTRKVQDDLRKLGVQIGKKTDVELSADISCWLEMLPLVRAAEFVAPPEQTPVLFDLDGGEQLARLATEMLRLGNDRQTYCWLEEKGGESRALLRVIGPPYYSLLRALDDPRPEAPRAFVEKSPRVWVQVGYDHPLAGKIKPPQRQMILLRPPRTWIYLPEGEFRDIYDVLEFDLPGVKAPLKQGELESKFTVPLRLARGAGTEPPELWVIRNNPFETVNELVQKSKDDDIARFSFTVAEGKNRQSIILKVRPSKLQPPTLVIDGIGFVNFKKMPNLFVPVGWRLHPPLRRDIVRGLLAEDTDLLTWLYPDGNGQFTPESIQAGAFRPLTDWVEYIIDREKEPLRTWMQSMTFAFESFVCDEEGAPRKPKPPPVEKPRGQGKGGSLGAMHDGDASIKDQGKGGKEAKAQFIEEEVSLVPVEPSVQQLRLRELEEQFAKIEGSLDAPERSALWPEMAQLNSSLSSPNATAHVDDAAICWANALWANEDWPESWVWSWVRTEALLVPARSSNGRGKGSSWAAVCQAGGKPREVSGEDLDRVLGVPEPSQSDVRTLAVYLVWASRKSQRPVDLTTNRLNVVQRFLEANETSLSVRACWLTWDAFFKLTSNDVLALARARDRLLERLFHNGLRPEMDLPNFLRFADQPATQRFRGIKQWLVNLCNTACEWSREANSAQPTEGAAPTLAYIRLLFAFALARLNEKDATRELIEQARPTLAKAEDAHQFLLEAFLYRIKLVQEGRKNSGPLPADQMEYLQKAMEKIQRYVVDRLRQHSRVLEPIDKVDPYLDWGAKVDELATKLAEVVRMTDKNLIAATVLKLLRDAPKGHKGNEVRARVLRTALEVSPRVTEEFALEMLTQFGPTWDGLPDVGEVGTLIERAELLERGLFVAAHFDKREHIQALVLRFQKLLRDQKGNAQALQAIEKLASESLRGLRKLGMRDEIDVLLRQMADLILKGQDVGSAAVKNDRNWPTALRALLHVAAGWLYFGRDREAEPIITAARTLLFSNEQKPKEQSWLAKVYARTVGGASVEVVQKRLDEMFHHVSGIRDTLTTSKYYSLLQLDVVEAVVLAIAGEDTNFGGDARRWLDDDEFIVRRRIHRDFHAAKKKG